MPVSDEQISDIGVKGRAIYNEKLKAVLEPAHNNEYVAIHVDTGDFAIGRSWITALQAILQRHEPDGRLVGMKIGDEPDYGLAARLVGSRIDGRADK